MPGLISHHEYYEWGSAQCGSGCRQAGGRQCTDLDPFGVFAGSVDLNYLFVLLFASENFPVDFHGTAWLRFPPAMCSGFFPQHPHWHLKRFSNDVLSASSEEFLFSFS